MVNYVVSGAIIVDNVIPYGKRKPVAVQLGGGAMYALTGIKLWDERLSTVSAERALLEDNMRRTQRKQTVDQVAAAIILQSYLDAKE